MKAENETYASLIFIAIFILVSIYQPKNQVLRPSLKNKMLIKRSEIKDILD